MTVAEILDKLGQTKQAGNELYVKYKQFKQEEDLLKSELLSKLRDDGLKSIKGQGYTASISETPTIVIKNEAEVMEWLRNTPDVEEDFYIGVKKPEFNTLAKQMLKETGEVAFGAELEVRESLTVKANKQKTEKHNPNYTLEKG